MVLEYKVSELEKILKQKQRIAWLRMRAKIIVLARAISNYTRLAETLKDLDRNIDKRKEELNTIETEVSHDDFSHISQDFLYIRFIYVIYASYFRFFLSYPCDWRNKRKKRGIERWNCWKCHRQRLISPTCARFTVLGRESASQTVGKEIMRIP